MLFLTSSLTRPDAAPLEIQLVLYQGSQVVSGQITVAVLRAWSRRVRSKNERLLTGTTRSPSGTAVDLAEQEKSEHGESVLPRSRDLEELSGGKEKEKAREARGPP